MILPLKHFTHPLLDAIKGVSHGFFTRYTGMSQGGRARLNVSHTHEEQWVEVDDNRQLVAQAFGLQAQDLWTLKQVHGTQVQIWDQSLRHQKQAVIADGWVSSCEGVLLGVMTADCVPVLFAHRRLGIVGCAHAGWRGALEGILDGVVDSMCQKGACEEEIVCAIGPCIHWSSYQVRNDFYDQFMDLDHQHQQFFRSCHQDQDRYRFNLPGFVRWRLEKKGLRHIGQVHEDTFEKENHFFSYRRSTVRSDPHYGCQISVVMLNKKK